MVGFMITDTLHKPRMVTTRPIDWRPLLIKFHGRVSEVGRVVISSMDPCEPGPSLKCGYRIESFMGKRQTKWAATVRAALIVLLGGRCRCCGRTAPLEMDCIVPQGDRHHKMSSAGRVSFYKKEMARGNLQLLCAACHSRKTSKENIQ
jgi:5-methylcytosine-specific restriction endonuclease McrA